MIIITTMVIHAEVAFKYNAYHVAIVKEVTGRRWNADRKVWEIPIGHVPICAKLFQLAGEVVVIDGVDAAEWQGRSKRPPTPQSSDGKNPFGPLFNYLPDDLHMPVYKALAKVLHPDMGGEKSIMQALNEFRPKN